MGITVSGVGEANAAPDMVEVDVGVSVLANTVEDGKSWFLFERPKPSALAAAVRRAGAAWRQPGRWREMQRAGMRRDFSWSAAARRYADLYSGLARARAT